MTKIKKANYVGNFMGFGTSFDGAVYGRGVLPYNSDLHGW